MYSYYIIALVPIIIGFILACINTKISWIEWIWGSGIALATAGILHLITITSMTSDVQTYSGQIVGATWYPQYVERYQVAIDRTESYPSINADGELCMESREVFDHYEDRYRTHDPYGEATSFYGKRSENYTISKSTFDNFVSQFGEMVTARPTKEGFCDGDPNIYMTKNINKPIIPTVTERSWDNKVKASPSTFSFKSVDDKVPVFPYPKNNNPWRSNRLVGDAINKINIVEFDKMNSRIGLARKANVVIVGFNSADRTLGTQQRDKWYGGKKNDIVICYGFAPLEEGKSAIVWAYAFGWVENDKMLRNLESIVMDGDITGAILPLVEKEIMANYVKKDWSKIDMMSVSPSSGWMWFYCIFVLVTQVGLYVFFLTNEDDKGYGAWMS